MDEKAHTYTLQDVPHYKTLYPHVNESRLVRKIDLRLVPILSALYLLAFLDRYVASPSIVQKVVKCALFMF